MTGNYLRKRKWREGNQKEARRVAPSSHFLNVFLCFLRPFCRWKKVGRGLSSFVVMLA